MHFLQGTRGEAAVPDGVGPDQRGRAAQAAATVHREGRRLMRLAGAEEALQDVHRGTTWRRYNSRTKNEKMEISMEEYSICMQIYVYISVDIYLCVSVGLYV